MTSTLIGVYRQLPPALGTCRACGARLEWVRTHADRLMPVDAPLVVEREYEGIDGRTVVMIEAARSHFATCADAARFRRRKDR